MEHVQYVRGLHRLATQLSQETTTIERMVGIGNKMPLGHTVISTSDLLAQIALIEDTLEKFRKRIGEAAASDQPAIT